MSKLCKNCGQVIPRRVTRNGKITNCQRRVYCYSCSPYGSGNNKLAKLNMTDVERADLLASRKQKKNQNTIKSQKKLRRERKLKLLKENGGECLMCGYSKCPRALEFHHFDPNEKQFGLSTLGYTCSWEKLKEESQKCIVLCCRCHREIEDNPKLELGLLKKRVNEFVNEVAPCMIEIVKYNSLIATNTANSEQADECRMENIKLMEDFRNEKARLMRWADIVHQAFSKYTESSA